MDDAAATAALLNRLGNQFGDLDVKDMILSNKREQLDEEKKDDENYDSDESSLLELSPEELLVWQQAQFKKGDEKVRAKKMSDENLTPLEKRRLLRQSQSIKVVEDDDWEDISPLPRLEAESYFFPSILASKNNVDNSDEDIINVGTHPMLLNLAESAATEVMGGAWKRLFSSYYGDGLSFLCLLNSIRGYAGPTVLLMEVIPSAKHSITQNEKTTRATIGFYTTSTWIESTSYFGSEECFLFRIDNSTTQEDRGSIRLLRPKNVKKESTIKKNSRFMYCNPTFSRVASCSRYTSGTNGAVHGIGIGGTSRKPRIHITETFEECCALSYDDVFEAGQLLDESSFENSLHYFDIQQIEVFGVGGQAWINDALSAREEDRQRILSNLKKAQRVQNKEDFIDDLRLMDNNFFRGRDSAH